MEIPEPKSTISDALKKTLEKLYEITKKEPYEGKIYFPEGYTEKVTIVRATSEGVFTLKDKDTIRFYPWHGIGCIDFGVKNLD